MQGRPDAWPRSSSWRNPLRPSRLQVSVAVLAATAALGASLLATAPATLSGTAVAAAQADNTLTAQEKSAGWRLLFDGSTTKGWRNAHADKFPEQGMGGEGRHPLRGRVRWRRSGPRRRHRHAGRVRRLRVQGRREAHQGRQQRHQVLRHREARYARSRLGNRPRVPAPGRCGASGCEGGA